MIFKSDSVNRVVERDMVTEKTDNENGTRTLTFTIGSDTCGIVIPHDVDVARAADTLIGYMLVHNTRFSAFLNTETVLKMREHAVAIS